MSAACRPPIDRPPQMRGTPCGNTAGTPREHLFPNVCGMNASYMIYLAERPRTVAEQRAEDQLAGELGAAIAGLWRSLKKPMRF